MLQVQNLTRTYDGVRVVDDVSFDVRPGRLTGFVGANGAGKTTTMRMIMGVLAPTEGEVRWQQAPITTGTRRTFGYMPEERGLYPRMTLVDQLVFLARLHGLTKPAATERARHLLHHFGLDDRRGDLLDELSLGNQQRVQIAAALVHEPTALVLDEPFSGLDPLAVDAMVELLHAETGPDVPVLFSSHQLELVERLCDDLVILSGGQVVVSGSTEELRQRGPQRYRLVLAGVPEDAVAHRTRELIDGRGDVALARVTGGEAYVDLDGVDPAAVLADLAARGPVQEFHRHVEPLAHVFREVTR